MKNTRIFSALFVVLVLSSCTSLRTAFDYDKEIDFAQYHSFAFYKEGMEQLKVNTLDKKRFVQAIIDDLQSKGMKKNTESPDLLINIIITGKDKVSLTDDYPLGYVWWYPAPSITVRQYTESTIYIDLIDRAKNQLVWQGKGTDEFHASERNKEARIRETVTQILAQYPYGKTK